MAKLTTNARNSIPAGRYAFPNDKKEPLENAAHVRNAIVRFNQVKGVTDAEREIAWKRILSAARKFGVDVQQSAKRHPAD